LTVADGILFTILSAAGLLRLFELGAIPLSPAEADSAWSLWRLAQPGNGMADLGSPAFASLSIVLAQIAGYSDGVVRLVPALAGLCMVATPWLLRKQIGSNGALMASGFLAVSPIHSAISRTAGGDSIAILAALFMAVSWIRYRDSKASQWLLGCFLALGLGLTTAPLFYGALVSLLLAALAQWALSSPEKRVSLFPTDQQSLRSAVFGGFLTFMAASTMLLLYPAGMGATAELMADWLADFGFRGGLARLANPVAALVRYEPLLLVPGIASLIWAFLVKNRVATFFAFWMASALLLVVLQPGAMPNALLALVPGYLLLAMHLEDLFRPGINGITWGAGLTVLLAGSLILVNIARYSRAAAIDPQDFSHVWVALLTLAAALATLYMAGSVDPVAALRGATAGWALLLVFFGWGTAWWLGHEAANDPRARWVDVGTDDDVRLLIDVAERVSLQATGSSTSMEIFSLVDSPVLRWYLRDFSELSFGQVLPPSPRHMAIIGPANGPIAVESDYLGADFGLHRSTDGTRLPGSVQSSLVEAIRWWLFHDSPSTLHTEKLIFWWRSNLMQGI
jgi:hypothetical protein